jgi:hypothetical protein
MNDRATGWLDRASKSVRERASAARVPVEDPGGRERGNRHGRRSLGGGAPRTPPASSSPARPIFASSRLRPLRSRKAKRLVDLNIEDKLDLHHLNSGFDSKHSLQLIIWSGDLVWLEGI